jgi:hypothetical protein
MLALAVAVDADARPSTLGEVLACENDVSPAACLFRAGARGWEGDSLFAPNVMAAIIRLGLDDAGLRLGDDEARTFAQMRAVAEAGRRDALGLAAEQVLAPIAALPEGQFGLYVEFAAAPEAVRYLDRVWGARASSAEVARLALQRAEALAERDYDRSRVALAYASRGMIDEGRAVVQRLGDENLSLSFWIEAEDFEAAEHALRAREDPHPVAMMTLASAAAEAGDRERALRLARELLDTWVRGQSSEAAIRFNPIGLAEMAGGVFALSGDVAAARRYADELMQGQAQDGELFSAHAYYAMAILLAAGDEAGACAVARTLADGAGTAVAGMTAEGAARERAARAKAAATTLARCGETERANALAASYGVDDFWLDYYLGRPLDADDHPYAGGLMQAAQRDIAAGRRERAGEVLRVLFVAKPFLMPEMLAELGDPETTAAWRGGGAFAALRERLLRQGRSASTALHHDDRKYVFAAALSLSDAP